MRNRVKRLTVVALIGLPVAVGVIVPAAPSGASTTIHAVIRNSATPAVVPNSTIKGNGKKAKYSPTALTVAEDTVNSCSTGFVSLTLTNKGKKTQNVTLDGSPFFGLPKKTVENICFYGGSAGDTVTLGLSNATNSITYKSTLTLTTSS